MRSHHKLRALSLLLVAMALLAAVTGGVYAFLSAISGPGNNNLTPAPETDPVIATAAPDATVAGSLFVSVGDIGYPVYIRAAVVITWETASGEVYGQLPVEGSDYAISLNDEAWFKNTDGFYYHRESVESNGQSEILIHSISALSDAPQGYSLHIQLVAQTIQAVGTTDQDANGNPVKDGIPAVTAAWGIAVDPTTNTLVAPT